MTEKTEAAVQREYLNGRLRDAGWAKDNELWQMFKMDEQTLPRTYKELIDKIKNDKFKLNEKRTKFIDAATADGSLFDIYGCFDGIIWDGGPDIDGYNAATAEMQKARQNAKDVIMGGVYADSMKAIKEFEAWVPTNKPN